MIADPFPLVRSGLRRVLEQAPEPFIQVLAEAATAQQTSDVVARHGPHVCLLGMDFEVHPASERIRNLVQQHASTALVLLPPRETAETNETALRYGAKGIYSKLADPGLLPRCVHEVRRGGLWFERAITARVLGSLLLAGDGIEDAPGWRNLTDRERDVAERICLGDVNKEVAARLHMSQATVAHHLTHIYRKLNVADRTGLMLFARHHALFSRK